MGIKRLTSVIILRILLIGVCFLSPILAPMLLVIMFEVLKGAVLMGIHVIESIFLKGVEDLELEAFPYLRVNLNIPNDYGYQDWLYSSINFINNNLNYINDFSNDYQGGFLTRTAVVAVFMLPITLFSASCFAVTILQGEFDA